MATQREEFELEVSSERHRPIELVTENGFHVVRRWEVEHTTPPADGVYRFFVHNEDHAGEPREVVVEVGAECIAQIERCIQGRVPLSSSFWIYCAERHLAAYLWESAAYPPDNTLKVDPLTPEDFALALRWGTT